MAQIYTKYVRLMQRLGLNQQDVDDEKFLDQKEALLIWIAVLWRSRKWKDRLDYVVDMKTEEISALDLDFLIASL